MDIEGGTKSWELEGTWSWSVTGIGKGEEVKVWDLDGTWALMGEVGVGGSLVGLPTMGESLVGLVVDSGETVGEFSKSIVDKDKSELLGNIKSKEDKGSELPDCCELLPGEVSTWGVEAGTISVPGNWVSSKTTWREI
jgi:hypothetical protein